MVQIYGFKNIKNIKILDSNLVYPFLWNQLDNFFFKNSVLPENTFGIHWYNGADVTKEFIYHFEIMLLYYLIFQIKNI